MAWKTGTYDLPPRLSPQQRIIAWRLAERRWVQTAELVNALYGNREDGGALTATNVVHRGLHDLRVSVGLYGLVIESEYRLGYRVRPDHQERYMDLLAAEIEAHARRPQLTLAA